MSALHELQVQFQDRVLHEREGMEQQIVGTERVDASTRLGIYANAYRLRLIEVLQSDYETLHTLLGDEAFDKLTRDYIDQHPSSHPNIRWFGKHMADHLEQHEPYCAHPVLGETARFEWALQTAFDATDTELVDIDAVAQIPPQAWPEMCPVFHDSVQRLRFAWNTVDFWRAVQAEQAPPQPGALPSPVDWLIWRQGLQPHFRSLEVDEAWAVDAVLTGQSFGEICEGLCEWIDPEQVGFRAASLLKRWVTEGMVTAVRAV